MTTLDLGTLTHVTGGVTSTSTNAALTQSLTTIQSSLATLASNNNNNQSNSLLPMMMAVALSRR
jgi:hypothetical protein